MYSYISLSNGAETFIYSIQHKTSDIYETKEKNPNGAEM
jgi:hypothetical protein